MSEDDKDKALPGDHGQFGVDNATEEYPLLKDRTKPTPKPSEIGDGAERVEV